MTHFVKHISIATAATVAGLLIIALLSDGGEAKKGYTKATISRAPWELEPNATAATGAIAAPILEDVRATVLAEYPQMVVVEVDDRDKAKLEQKAKKKSALVTFRDAADRIYLNGRVLDARDGHGKVPEGLVGDPPYRNGEQGTFLIQFVGAVKPA